MKNYVGGFDKTLLNLAQSNENERNERAKIGLNLKALNMSNKDKRAKDQQQINDRKSLVSGFKKIHPKTTAGLSDDEIYAMGDRINKIHNDKSKAKFVDARTTPNGDRVMTTFMGKDKDGNPIYKDVIVGKAKDHNKSKEKDDIFVKATKKANEKSEAYLTSKKKNKDGTYDASINLKKDVKPFKFNAKFQNLDI